MSHLPLDARAILHYLNELGYRNISAEQLKEFLKDLRKLIKNEERMGVNTQQDDYYESLFRRTTASFRAKHGKENVPMGTEQKRRTNENHIAATTSKQARSCRERQRVLRESNHHNYDSTTTTTDNSIERRPPRSAAKQTQNNEITSHATNSSSIKSIVEDVVAQILQEKFSNGQPTRKKTQTELLPKVPKVEFMDAAAMKAVVQDLVNTILKDKLYGPCSSPHGSAKPLKSAIEDIVNEKIKEHSSKLTHFSDPSNGLANLNRELQQKLNISKEKIINSANSSKTIDSQALVAELLANNDNTKSQSKRTSSDKQSAAKTYSQIPEWEQVSGEKGATGIKRLPRSGAKLPEWQETEGKSQPLSTAARRARSPTASSASGRSSSRSRAAKGVLIPRSTSQGRSRKPNNSDPVALYQYYKNEWDYFRKQIPGETNHNRLRWHVRQRFLDPE